MTKKMSKTALIALGVGAISKGAEQVAMGNYLEGLVMVLAGISVVYGYHIVEEKDMEGVASQFIDSLDGEEDTQTGG